MKILVKVQSPKLL